MEDRVSLYPGRVTLTPVAGQANTYDMVRADQPTQEGTPLNKASLLKDSTAALLKLGTNATPDDAFLALFIGSGKYGYRVKVQLSDGSPCAGAVVSGITAIPGFTLTTGADGYMIGTSEAASVSIGCTSPFVDQTPPVAQTVTSTGTVTDVVLTLVNNSEIIQVTTSGVLSVSPVAQTVDITAIGGGGGGGGGSSMSTGGGGGGGGNVAVALGKAPSSTISAIIGAGGAAGASQSAGGAGGTTTVTTGEVSVLATGGSGGNAGTSSSAAGGSGNGPGGTGAETGSSGSAGTVRLFNDSSLSLAGGGGGGGGSSIGNVSAAGGTPYGGIGYGRLIVTQLGQAVEGPEAGKGPGGGGGGGGMWYDPSAGAAGYRGQVWLRFHF